MGSAHSHRLTDTASASTLQRAQSLASNLCLHQHWPHSQQIDIHSGKRIISLHESVMHLALDAVTNSAALSSASSLQRWCVTLARGTVTERRSRSTLAGGTLVDSRLTSTQVAGPTHPSCPWAQRPAPSPAENMNEGNGHKGTKVPFQRPDTVSPPSRLPAEGACCGIQQPESCLGGRTGLGTWNSKPEYRPWGEDAGIWDTWRGDETTSIPSTSRSLKGRTDSDCVTPSAARPLPTPHPGLAQPA